MPKILLELIALPTVVVVFFLWKFFALTIQLKKLYSSGTILLSLDSRSSSFFFKCRLTLESNLGSLVKVGANSPKLTTTPIVIQVQILDRF